MQKDGWRGAERVFGWSFYSQGSSNTASGDMFIAEALRWFRDEILLSTEQGRTDVAKYYAVAPRVVAAIDDGLSCRRAAERFGISAASAIRWRSRLKEAGDVVPKRPGGDRRSQRIEAHSQLILDAVTVKASEQMTAAGTHTAQRIR